MFQIPMPPLYLSNESLMLIPLKLLCVGFSIASHVHVLDTLLDTKLRTNIILYEYQVLKRRNETCVFES